MLLNEIGMGNVPVSSGQVDALEIRFCVELLLQAYTAALTIAGDIKQSILRSRAQKFP